MLLIKRFFRDEVAADMRNSSEEKTGSSLVNANIKIDNRNLEGLQIKDIPAIGELGVVVSRVYHDGQLSIAHEESVIHVGDILLVIGPQAHVSQFTLVVGSKSDIDLKALPSRIIHSRVVVTRKEVIGRTLEEIKLQSRYNVVATRVARADVEFIVSDKYVLQLADNLALVGEEASVAQAAALLGNSPKDLNHPQLVPAFIGIALGVILGSIPISIPGLSMPVKLGLAGGPLIVAICLSYAQTIGPLNWYMPPAGNLMLRELGIVMFLACVGLNSGGKFVETIVHGNGLAIMALAFALTVIPVLAVGIFAKARYKLSYMSLCGVLAGSMTDPPALAFANAMGPSNQSAMSYATVYPLIMILRIISAQVMVMLLMR